ncbi:UNVERIFIED_CONTAM: T9SS type A sorting domain-containing protein, partial [Salmonella enterica subsp. enterica serovar Weltevreden]
DILGKTVLKGESNVNDFSIPVADLNQGIYLLRLNVNDTVTYKKIVKE